MSTNYYIKYKISSDEKEKFHKLIDDENIDDLIYELRKCESSHNIHVGKYVHGWQFLFDSNNFIYFDANEESVISWLKDNEEFLYDEYGRHITFDDFMKMVKSQENGLDYMEYQMQNKTPDGYLTVADFHIGKLRFSNYTDFS